MTLYQAGRVADALAAVPVPMLAVDGGARIIAANDPAFDMLGRELLDRPFVTVLRHAGINAALDAVLAQPADGVGRAAARRPGAGGGDGTAMRRVAGAAIAVEGRTMSCTATVTPMPQWAGPGALIALLDDGGAELAEQMRRDFVANVSHELRTPLTAMMGFIETLRGPARNDAVARDRFLDIMETEAGRMNRLIGDLLSLSRVQAEERRRPSDAVDLAALLRGVADTLTPMASAAGVEVDLRGTDRPVSLPGDHDQLVQVFQNLVENAVKYGGSGGVVTVTLRRVDHEPVLRGPGWAVDVEDRGDGIEAMHLPRLTERFYRVDTHRSRAKGGTGLGLAIVKHIVSRHRGRLRIDSEKGQGSRFTVILPEAIGRG